MNTKESLAGLGIHESWFDILFPLFKGKSMENILKAYHSNPSLPEKHNVFRVFSTPVEDIKVVILGQDPYPDDRATGIAFAVREYDKTPYSLHIIENSIRQETGTSSIVHFDKTLTHWKKQGVFLLNSALTTQKGNPGAHTALWRGFIETIIAFISMEVNPVWILMGKEAKSFLPKIEYSDKIKFKVITRTHPADQKYYIVFEGFVDETAKYINIKWI